MFRFAWAPKRELVLRFGPLPSSPLSPFRAAYRCHAVSSSKSRPTFPRQPLQIAFPGTRSLLYSTVVVHNQGRSRLRRAISFFVISTTSFVVGAFLALSYAPPFLPSWIIGRQATDEESLSLYKAPDDFSREVDEYIKHCPLAEQLRADANFTESRPHLQVPESIRAHNLTSGTLQGPDMIVVPPYTWNEKDGKSMVAIFYLGKHVSGHPGIVHGGLLATMLDEGMARCCFPALPNKVGVTANLQINYRKPTKADQYLVLRAKTTKVEGRKAWVEGWIEPLVVGEGGEPQHLVDANALFIEPRYAGLMKTLYRTS